MRFLQFAFYYEIEKNKVLVYNVENGDELIRWKLKKIKDLV